MLRPIPPTGLLFHGAVGPLDELLSLLPLIVGWITLMYFYFFKYFPPRKPSPVDIKTRDRDE